MPVWDVLFSSIPTPIVFLPVSFAVFIWLWGLLVSIACGMRFFKLPDLLGLEIYCFCLFSALGLFFDSDSLLFPRNSFTSKSWNRCLTSSPGPLVPAYCFLAPLMHLYFGLYSFIILWVNVMIFPSVVCYFLHTVIFKIPHAGSFSFRAFLRLCIPFLIIFMFSLHPQAHPLSF